MSEATYRIQQGAAIFQGRMKAAQEIMCPECGKPVDGISEHAYFMYDVIVVRCTDCRSYSIVGSDKWVKFPGVGGPFEEQIVANELLNAIAKEASENQLQSWRDRQAGDKG